MTKILEKETAIENLTDPMGNKWKVTVAKMYPGLFKISIEEGAPQTLPPQNLRGHYTNADRATVALRTHLERLWSKSDSVASKQSGKRTAKVEELSGTAESR